MQYLAPYSSPAYIRSAPPAVRAARAGPCLSGDPCHLAGGAVGEQIPLEERDADGDEGVLVWHYVACGKTLTSSRSPEQLETLKQDTIALIDHVESTSEFTAKPSKLCNWCEFKGLCPNAKLDLPSDSAPSGPEPPPGIAEAPGDPTQLSLL